MNSDTARLYEGIELVSGPRYLTSAVFDPSTLALGLAGPSIWTDIRSATSKSTVYVALVSAGAIDSATVQFAAFDVAFGARTFGNPPPELRAEIYLKVSAAESMARHERILENAAAIALVGSWLEEGAGSIDEEECRDFEQIKADLDAERSSSRKLFP